MTVHRPAKPCGGIVEQGQSEPNVGAEAVQAAWRQAIAGIEAYDRNTRGIVVLGLDAPEADLAASFQVAAANDLVKDFAIGRTIFGNSARAWMTGSVEDTAAIDEMAHRYARLCDAWDAARTRDKGER